MEYPYDEKTMDQIERYLAGEMPEAEHKEFEKRIASDEQLQQIVTNQRMLIEGIQVSNYMEQRDRWKAVQESVEAELDIEKDEVLRKQTSSTAQTSEDESVSKKPTWHWLKWLGAILTGALLVVALQYFQAGQEKNEVQPSEQEQSMDDSRPIADVDEDDEMPLGFTGEEVEQRVNYLEIKNTAGQLSITNQDNRIIVLQETDEVLVTYQLADGSFTLFLPTAVMASAVNSELQWLVVTDQAGLSIQYLQWGPDIFRIAPSKEKQLLGSIKEPALLNLTDQ